MSLYVYAFVDAPGGPMTVARHRLEILSIGGIHVVVERLAAPPAASETALRTQHAIVDRLARTFAAVLPARFGSFMSPDGLQQVIGPRRVELRKALRRLRGRVQMTARIATPVAEPLPPPRGRAPSGTAYLNARRAALSGPRPRLAAALSEAVHSLAHDERIETDAAHGRTALFHVIDRADVRRYRATVDRFAAAEGERVVVTGPYAPFAFTPVLQP
jgi:hypothetical protein